MRDHLIHAAIFKSTDSANAEMKTKIIDRFCLVDTAAKAVKNTA
ncbi:Uncharacterised protein [Vibrio cholerae]|nr:Uncharacterised protein [Vibrio cholerae]CSI34746.1 Uncharacterised protein [Vibrio cholerae]